MTVGGPRPRRAERGVRRTGDPRHARARPRPCEGQRQRRRDRHRVIRSVHPARGSRPRCCTRCGGAARGTGWRRCASAWGRALQRSSRRSNDRPPAGPRDHGRRRRGGIGQSRPRARQPHRQPERQGARADPRRREHADLGRARIRPRGGCRETRPQRARRPDPAGVRLPPRSEAHRLPSGPAGDRFASATSISWARSSMGSSRPARTRSRAPR